MHWYLQKKAKQIIKLRSSTIFLCCFFLSVCALSPEGLDTTQQKIDQLYGWWVQQGSPERWSEEQVYRGLETLSGVEGGMGCFQGGRALCTLFELLENNTGTFENALAAHSSLLIGRLWQMRFLASSHIQEMIVYGAPDDQQGLGLLRRQRFTYGPNPQRYAQYHLTLVDPQNHRHLDERVHLQPSWAELFLSCLCCGVKNVCGASDNPHVMALVWWVHAARLATPGTTLHREIQDKLREYVENPATLFDLACDDASWQPITPGEDYGDRDAPLLSLAS